MEQAAASGARLLFQFRQSASITQIHLGAAGPDASKMDKIQALKEILAQDPNNNFARYGLAVELANRGETAAALAEFDALLAKEPGYTAGYSMAAQTLAAAGRIPEAIERFKAGISCATQSGNHHAASQMQILLDELDR